MNCNYCRSANAKDERRCRRCGRPLASVPAAATVYPTPHTSGSLATAPAAVMTAAPADFATPAQNVIPFETIARRPLAPVTAVAAPTTPLVQTQHQPTARRRPVPSSNNPQAVLDFIVAPPPGPRTLKTSVEALIGCDAPVATPRHRAIAASLDAAVIVTAFGIFLITFHLLGGSIQLDRHTAPWFAGALFALAMFYGVLWSVAGRDTAGMRWTGLQLIDFDGYAPDPTARGLRLLGTLVSMCAGGLGMAWALFDEEQLAWNDHMSKTFPTLQESESNFVRKRRK